jgi:carbon monoxide dehydrogenase subunit G
MAAVLLLLVARSHAGAPSDMDVDVQVTGQEVREIRASVSLFVPAPRERVWEVITDYERAPEFMRNLKVSRIVDRRGDTLRVHQKSKVRVGPFAVPVETVRDVRLVAPARTETRLVSGSMQKYYAITELVPERGGTRINYRLEAATDSMLAGFAGESIVRRETEEQFRQLRDEILRRQHVAARQ